MIGAERKTLPAEVWAEQYRSLKRRAEASRKSKGVALDRACREAGIGAFHGCVMNNALISAEQGRPWREVDYSALRRARRIERSLFDADRIVARWASRVRPER